MAAGNNDKVNMRMAREAAATHLARCSRASAVLLGWLTAKRQVTSGGGDAQPLVARLVGLSSWFGLLHLQQTLEKPDL